MIRYGICAVLSSILVTALPMAAISAELIEAELGEEEFTSSPVTEDTEGDGLLSADTELIEEDILIEANEDDEFDLIIVEEVAEEEDNQTEVSSEITAEEQSELSEEVEAVVETELDYLASEETETDEYSGECGAVEGTVFWKLDEEGTLHLYGEGEMRNWNNPEDVPWAHLSEQIKNLDVQDGVSGIGSYAFSGCNSLTSVRIG